MADNKKYILYNDIHKLVSSTADKVKEFKPDFMVRIWLKRLKIATLKCYKYCI